MCQVTASTVVSTNVTGQVGSLSIRSGSQVRTVAQAANPRTDVPSEVRSLQRQHSTLEGSPLITIITRWLVQLGLVICARLLVWSVVMLV